MSCHWNKARNGRIKALEKLAERRMGAEMPTAPAERRSRRSPLAQAIYSAELSSRVRPGLVH